MQSGMQSGSAPKDEEPTEEGTLLSISHLFQPRKRGRIMRVNCFRGAELLEPWAAGIERLGGKTCR